MTGRWTNIAWGVVVALATGCLREPGPEPVMTVTLTRLPAAEPNQYMLFAEVAHFDASREVYAELVLGRDDKARPEVSQRSGPLDTPLCAFATGTLDPDAAYHASVRIIPKDGYDPRAELRWITGPGTVVPPEPAPSAELGPSAER